MDTISLPVELISLFGLDMITIALPVELIPLFGLDMVRELHFC